MWNITIPTIFLRSRFQVQYIQNDDRRYDSVRQLIEKWVNECVCVCVCDRERESEHNTKKHKNEVANTGGGGEKPKQMQDEKKTKISNWNMCYEK